MCGSDDIPELSWDVKINDIFFFHTIISNKSHLGV